MKNDIYKALLAIVTEYAEGRGPLVKYKEQNDKIMELVSKDPTLFSVLGFETEKQVTIDYSTKDNICL